MALYRLQAALTDAWYPLGGRYQRRGKEAYHDKKPVWELLEATHARARASSLGGNQASRWLTVNSLHTPTQTVDDVVRQIGLQVTSAWHHTEAAGGAH